MTRGIFEDITGQRFNRLVVIERAENDRNGNTQFRCRCDCGNEITALSGNIRAGKTQSCGCLNQENRTKAPGISNANRVWRQYKANARKRNIPFELEKDDFMSIIVQPCHYCGSSLQTIQNDNKSNGTFAYTGIDRIDNDNGYIYGNVAPCCHTCNIAKQEMSYREFVEHARKIVMNTGWIFAAEGFRH